MFGRRPPKPESNTKTAEDLRRQEEELEDRLILPVFNNHPQLTGATRTKLFNKGEYLDKHGLKVLRVEALLSESKWEAKITGHTPAYVPRSKLHHFYTDGSLELVSRLLSVCSPDDVDPLLAQRKGLLFCRPDSRYEIVFLNPKLQLATFYSQPMFRT